MARIRVVTDSACDLPPDMAERLGITVVPLSIRFGSDEFVDRVTLTTGDFWARCASSQVLPETSAPSPGAFQEAFLAAAGDGYDSVVCINISSKLSGTHQSARAGAEAVKDQIPVRTVDSRSVTMGQGLIVLDTAAHATSGASLEDTVARAEMLTGRTQVFGAVDTLEHLEKGGRIGGAKALLGTMLSIKPVVSVQDGKVGEESKQRTRSRSLRYMAGKAHEAQDTGGIVRIAVANGAAGDIDDFLAMIQDVRTDHPVVVVDLGPVVGTHTGPGTIGLCMITAG
ncbi:MAG: DegV family protein [Acidimicrobiales bacterium]